MLDPFAFTGTADAAELLARLDVLEKQALVDQADLASLHRALESARRIGAAIGIVMLTLKVGEDAAFDVLRHASQTENRKLREVADDVVSTGVVPRVAVR